MEREMSVVAPWEISKMERLERINLINKLSGIKGANLIGTCNSKGENNLAIFNSVIHIGANPACMGFIMRPTTVERHTYDNILETKHFTINNVTPDICERAHLTSAKYDRTTSEFEACNLTPVTKNFPAPFVGESSLQIGLSFVDEQLIQVNATRLMIGKIACIYIDKSAVGSDGDIDLAKLNAVGVNGLDSYYTLNKLATYPYAKSPQTK